MTAKMTFTIAKLVLKSVSINQAATIAQLTALTVTPSTPLLKKYDDDDECEDDTKRCHNTQIYVNNLGGYDCNCQVGQELKGDKCKDINECSDDTHNYNAVTKDCVNKSQGFECVCKNGYELVNGICILIGCEQGDYECNCKAGFEGDGFTCN